MSKDNKEFRSTQGITNTDKRIVGYASVFNSLSQDLGGFKEIIHPSAFTRSLKNNADVRALVEHDPSKILGRTKSGTLKLSEDGHGLRVEIDPPNTTVGRDTQTSIERGDLDSMSFGFVVRDSVWSKEDGFPIRTITDADIFDVSVVNYPAYLATEVALRSLTEWNKDAKVISPLDNVRRMRLRISELL